MAESNNKSAKKVIDVSQPSSVIESANSKSIIIGHSPMVRDSTIIEDSQDDSQPEQTTSEPSTHQLKINPLTEQQQANDQTTETKQQTSTLEVPKELKLEPSDALKKEISENQNQLVEAEKTSPKVDNVNLTEDQQETEPKTTTKIADDQPAKADSVEKQQDDQRAELDASIAKQAYLNGLIDSQKFFLPINSKEKRKNKKIILLGLLLCLVLAITWVDVALDAGLIANTYHLPHTHFFTLNR